MRKFLVSLAVALVVILQAGAAHGGPDGIAADIHPRVDIIEEGQAALVRLRVVCPEGYNVLEAFAYITQDGSTSQFGGFPATCDGRSRRVTARVSALDVAFHEGEAGVTSFLLVTTDGGSESLSDGDTRTVNLRRAR